MTQQLARVLKIRQAEEEKARRALAASLEALRIATDLADEAAAAVARDAREAGDAAQWDFVDAAHTRARDAQEKALTVVAEREAGADVARTVHQKALETVRAFERVLETRRTEAAIEEQRAEQRSFDEIAMLLRSTQQLERR